MIWRKRRARWPRPFIRQEVYSLPFDTKSVLVAFDRLYLWPQLCQLTFFSCLCLKYYLQIIDYSCSQGWTVDIQSCQCKFPLPEKSTLQWKYLSVGGCNTWVLKKFPCIVFHCRMFEENFKHQMLLKGKETINNTRVPDTVSFSSKETKKVLNAVFPLICIKSIFSDLLPVGAVICLLFVSCHKCLNLPPSLSFFTFPAEKLDPNWFQHSDIIKFAVFCSCGATLCSCSVQISRWGWEVGACLLSGLLT